VTEVSREGPIPPESLDSTNNKKILLNKEPKKVGKKRRRGDSQQYHTDDPPFSRKKKNSGKAGQYRKNKKKSGPSHEVSTDPVRDGCPYQQEIVATMVQEKRPSGKKKVES